MLAGVQFLDDVFRKIGGQHFVEEAVHQCFPVYGIPGFIGVELLGMPVFKSRSVPHG